MNMPESTEVRIARLEEQLKGSNTALILAREQLELWKASSNEWRKENIDQRSLFMTSDKAFGLLNNLEIRIAALEKARIEIQGKTTAFSSIWSVTISVIFMLIGIGSLLVNLLRSVNGPH